MKRWRILVVAFLVASVTSWSRGVEAYDPSEARCHNATPKVELTFDDAAPPARVHAVLDVLAGRGVRAGFFILGPWAAAHPDVMDRIRTEGHWLGNHTASHRALPSLSDDQILREIAGGVDGALLRPPYGAVDARVRRVAASRGYRLCLWTVDTSDWKGRSADQIRATAFREARPGGVVLLHLQGPSTIEALPGLIDGLRARGLELDAADRHPSGSVDPASGASVLLQRDGRIVVDGVVGGPAVAPAGDAVGIAMRPAASGRGYWVAQAGGGVQAVDGAPFLGSGRGLNRPLAGITPTPSGLGYWTVAQDGGVFAHGDAGFFGSAAGWSLREPVVALASTASGRGYWLLGRDGGVFSFGDAGYAGSPVERGVPGAFVSMTAMPSGDGYWVLDRRGLVLAFDPNGGDGSLRSLGADDDGGRGRTFLAIVADGPIGYRLVSDGPGV